MAYVQHIFSPWYHLIPFAFSAYTVYIWNTLFFILASGELLLLIYNYQLILYTYGEDDACVFFSTLMQK